MNGFCGAQSLFMSGRFLITSQPVYAWLALWFTFFGAIFDLLDGKVARWRQSSSMLGQELDSLADSISFGVAPTFAAFALGLRLPLDTLILTVFVCAGVARLARFNITAAAVPRDASGKAQYFEGLPIPSSLCLVCGMAICLALGRFEDAHGPWHATGAPLPVTGRLAQYAPWAVRAAGVPFGTLSVDFSAQLYKLLAPYLHRATATAVAESVGRFAVHKISLLWFAWALAMVSKTLRVPKP